MVMCSSCAADVSSLKAAHCISFDAVYVNTVNNQQSILLSSPQLVSLSLLSIGVCVSV